MVKLEEVQDEEFTRPQEGPVDEENDWDTDSESQISDAEPLDEDITDESLLDRVYALRDVIPPNQRRFLASSFSTASSWAKSSLFFGGKALWVVSTSALLVGVPWALAFAEEQQMMEMEREMKMQQSANELLTPGSGSQPQQGARPAL